MRRREFVKFLAGAAVAGNEAAQAERFVPPMPNVLSITAKSISTRGSIAAGSNQLEVASTVAFAVGDRIIIEIGGEQGRGLKGSVGVGGSWPQTLFETYAELKASPVPQRGCHAGVLTGREAGLVYQSDGNKWLGWDRNLPYTNEIVPLSLVANVTAITETTLILNKAARSAAAEANVYYDSSPLFEFLKHPPRTHPVSYQAIQLSPGVFYLGSGIRINQHDGLTFRGAGRNATIIKFPKGIPLEGVTVLGCHDITLEGLEKEDLSRHLGPLLHVLRRTVSRR